MLPRLCMCMCVCLHQKRKPPSPYILHHPACLETQKQTHIFPISALLPLSPSLTFAGKFPPNPFFLSIAAHSPISRRASIGGHFTYLQHLYAPLVSLSHQTPRRRLIPEPTYDITPTHQLREHVRAGSPLHFLLSKKKGLGPEDSETDGSRNDRLHVLGVRRGVPLLRRFAFLRYLGDLAEWLVLCFVAGEQEG